MTDNSSRFGLVCSGGGAMGAYQVGVLKYIHEHFSRGSLSPFQLFAGISCGSLNTSYYACHSYQAREAAARLEQLWLDFHIPQYQRVPLRNIGRSLLRSFSSKDTTWSLLDATPMFDIIRRGFSRTDLEKAFQSESTLGVSIAATEIASGYPCWFVEGPRAVEWDRFHSTAIKTTLDVQHVAASCSVPFFMPPTKIGAHYFVDGALNLQRPFKGVLSMGASHVLCINTRPPRQHTLPAYPEGYKPNLASMMRFVLRAFENDASTAEAEQIKLVNRFVGTELRHNYRPISVFLFNPSQKTIESAAAFQPDIPGRRGAGGRKHFLFHRDYIRQLIDHGYRDAGEKAEELKTFLGDGTQ